MDLYSYEDSWTAVLEHTLKARELIVSLLAGVQNRGKLSRLNMADERLREVADMLGYSPELLYTAARLLGQAAEFPNEDEDYR